MVHRHGIPIGNERRAQGRVRGGSKEVSPQLHYSSIHHAAVPLLVSDKHDQVSERHERGVRGIWGGHSIKRGICVR